jgi:hypothetical protein
MTEFNQFENELLTKCWDEKDKYKVNINPETNEASVIEVKTQNKTWSFGKSSDLFIKMLKYCDLEPRYINL